MSLSRTDTQTDTQTHLKLINTCARPCLGRTHTALLAIAAGLGGALVLALRQRARQNDWSGTYDHLRRRVGRTLLIALEFLLAAEIARSIFAGKTLNAALTLGVVVIVRTFLSIAIEMEISGRWPWNSAQHKPPHNSKTGH
ncbi:DUF1622 domain-containing protein [Lujinxingia sediminis]|uniref:DUF1622 domain-containing protein n=1 Tax=Lujinxingia sediminis TaxID=2480984 RepID=A0ABY0CPJ6_9DELT|nr:DUF1622 domain-containing protein [Lujinxingia sediminis]RVU42367.1 DUF1622 domain-containing protein [Lujinxingia sediminis]